MPTAAEDNGAAAIILEKTVCGIGAVTVRDRTRWSYIFFRLMLLIKQHHMIQ
jgi:hypothetical protein